MDVLNFISWIKRKDYRDVMPPDALTVVGVPDPKRDDRYLSIVVPISAFNIPAPYTLPIASATVLGGIKVGAGLTINGSGVLSATVSKGYVTIMQSGNTLSAVLSGIPGAVIYDWSFADSDSGFVFTSFTMLQNVTLSRITDTAQYIPLLIEAVGPGVLAAYRYTALVKLRVIDENGYVYSDTYNYSENRFIIE